ncbi:MAG: hypothetical protein H6Q68_817 [Firmicutes bacterium]|nr:hypothetical protein [Bacillota bacterium]
MMIVRGSVIVILIWMLAMPVFAAENLDAWNYFAPIYTEGSSKYKAFFVTEEVYEHASPGLTDLRIVDAQGEYVPFYIQSGSNILRQNKIIYKSEVVQSFKKNNDRYIDFAIIPLKNNTDVSGNSLIFELPQGNFLKHIEIYGSNDGDSWSYIGKDYVFRAEDREKNEVPVGGKSKYTYYRIVILDNPENIVLTNLRLSNQYTDSQWSSFVKSAQVDFDVKTDKNYSLVTFSNRQKLTIKQIFLEVEGNFQRNYKMYGDNQNGVLLKSGELYNLQLENVKVSGTNIDLSSTPTSVQTITIKIDNRDDRPLNIKSVRIEYYIDKLIFPDMGNTSYQLYFGNDKATKPKYEIELQKTYIEKEQQDSCGLGDIESMHKDVPVPSYLNMKYVFNGIMVIISILLIVLLISRMNVKR